MRRTLARLVLAASALSLAWTDAQACGDKFLVIGRGVRSPRARGAVQRASILLYFDPKGELPAALDETHFETDLKLAGHRVRRVEGRGALSEALEAGGYDVVLASIADMVALEREVAGAPSRPLLLPIIYNPSGEELAAAEKQYRCVMKSPSRKQDFLAVIDEAMVLQQKAARVRRK